MIRRAVLLLAVLATGRAEAGTFCDGAPFVSFSRVVREASAFVGKRFQTRGVIRTDAKEFTLITQDDATKHGLRVEGDAEAEAYARRHALSVDPTFDVLADLASKLRRKGMNQATPDMSEIVNYRQLRLLCGRVVSGSSGLVFVIDDSVLERSYLLPHKAKKRAP